MKKWIIGGVIVVGIGLIVAISNNLSSQNGTASSTKAPAAQLTVNTPAPDFTLKLSDDKTLTLADLKDKKPLIMLATFAGCGASEGQALTQIQKDYGDKVQIVAFDILDGERASALEHYNSDNDIHVPVAGYDRAFASAYRLNHPDATFIISKQGTITFQDQSVTTYETYKREVEKVL